MFRTGAQMFLLALLVGAFLLRESHHSPGAQLDERWADWLSVNCRRPAPPEPPVALIGIGDESLESHPWPWTPLDFSLFVQAALAFQPDVIGVEEVLEWNKAEIPAEERQKLPQYERILRDVLLRCPRLLLAARLGFPDDPQVVPPLQESPVVRKVHGDVRQIPEWTAIDRHPLEEYRLSGSVGFTNLPSEGEPVNSVPLVLRYRGQTVPSFVLQAALLWHQLQTDDVTVHLGSHVALGDKARIPIDGRGQMRVNFGVPRTIFPFDDLLLAAEQVAAKTKTVIPAERLRKSITLLVRTDKASRTVDVPAYGRISPGELFASALGTIQTTWFIHRIPWTFDAAFIGAIALWSAFLPRFRKRVAIASGALLLIAYGLAAMLVFKQWLIWLPALLPVGLVTVMTLLRLSVSDKVTIVSSGKLERPVIL